DIQPKRLGIDYKNKWDDRWCNLLCIKTKKNFIFPKVSLDFRGYIYIIMILERQKKPQKGELKMYNLEFWHKGEQRAWNYIRAKRKDLNAMISEVIQAGLKRTNKEFIDPGQFKVSKIDLFYDGA
ncbi:hypothetical protein C4561_01620, partial [candidate division WWE3 bacterium]